MPNDPVDSKAQRAERRFVGREPFIEAFDEALDGLHPERPSVLTFHGVGGIGKTALLEHLHGRARDLGADPAIGRVSFTERESRLPTRALAQMCSQLRAGGVSFPSFDVAYAHYWKLAYPDQPLAEAAIPLLEEGEMAAGILDAVREIPGLDLVSKIPRALTDTLRSVNNLGYLLRVRGDLAGAEPLFRRAAETAERVLGSEHPNTRLYRDNLRHLNESRDAEEKSPSIPLFQRGTPPPSDESE